MFSRSLFFSIAGLGGRPAFAGFQHSRAHSDVMRQTDNIAIETEQDCGAVAKRYRIDLHPAVAATEDTDHPEFQLIRYCTILGQPCSKSNERAVV